LQTTAPPPGRGAEMAEAGPRWARHGFDTGMVPPEPQRRMPAH